MVSDASGTGKIEAHNATTAWQASDLVVDPGLQRVECAGRPVELPKLSFDLLLALMEASPNFISNDELMTRVWKNLVVSPETVTQRVKLLRDALGDDPRQPKYIEGLRGRGYRLIPQVQRTDRPLIPVPAPETPSSPASSGNTAGPVGRTEQRWAVPVVVALMMLTGIVLWNQRPAPPAANADQPAADAARTAAILPFLDDVDENLGTGLADSIAAQLSGVRNLTVVSRYSTQALDMENLGPQAVGKKLGAGYLVQGRVMRQGPQLRVSASLLDSRTGEQVWMQQFTRNAEDFFGLQDAVAAGVKQALESRIAGLDTGLPVVERSANRDAWLAYLRGRAMQGRTTVTGAEAAAREFQQTLALDPTFVPAMAALYDARLQAVSLRRTGLDDARSKYAPLLERARRLQPDSGAVQLAEAIWSPAPGAQRVAGFEAGLARDPSNARAMTEFSELLDRLGRREDARRWLERAMRVDPLWPRAHFRSAQRNFVVVGAAVEQLNQRTLEMDPLYYPALQRHAKYQWAGHGETAHAISVIEKAIASDPENPWGYHTAIAFYLDAGDPAAAESLARINAVADGSTRALRAIYRGDWRAAGEAAYSKSTQAFGKPERWLVSMLIRDHALHTGQRARALEYLSENYGLAGNGPWALDTDNFREAFLCAHLLLLDGKKEEAMRRLDEVIAWNNANAHFGPIYHVRVSAQALALKGENDAALAELKRSFDANDHTFWWYTLRWDPTWAALRADPRFTQLIESERAAAAAQLAKVMDMQNAGTIPVRPPATP